MNKNGKQQYLPAAVKQLDADGVGGLHPQFIIVVQIIGDSRCMVSKESLQIVECVSEVTKERFEIALLADDITGDGERRKLKSFQRLIEKLCGGWRMHFFKSSASTTGMMLDRVNKVLLVNADAVLRMQYCSVIKLIGKLSGMIANVYKGVKSTVGGFSGPKGIKSLLSSKNADIVLVVSEKGLLFPPGFVLSAEEQMMRITITDTNLIVSAGRRRWIHRSAVELQFHVYKITVTVEDDAYLVAVPPDVLQTLGGPGAELWFELIAD
ncbi:hypothetical protein EXW96_23940 [Paenibacillus sp. JMULE4]|uniref:hypothetical protein n=1 Tax=Paenibacillus sp. JMULE4 TaxID=2518342 RepID=UPI001575521A|nr:hypothetical protein [Paenibacillus sp. JMULE4]NTZ20468.1 hypothetical protein [Paenibacillus sp. JMULE4]